MTVKVIVVLKGNNVISFFSWGANAFKGVQVQQIFNILVTDNIVL